MYFTHSFAGPVTAETAAITEYGEQFAAAVEDRLVMGVQFHPEKSSDTGLAILRNFLRLVTSREHASDRGMLAKRIIACLDVRDGQVVKGIKFEGLRSAGDPAALARRYNDEGIDELVILDVTATLEKRLAMANTVRAVAQRAVHSPLRGWRDSRADDAAAVVEAGADKVSLNPRRCRTRHLITRLANQYGSQAVIVAIDAKRIPGGFAVYARSGTSAAARDAVEWAREAEGRGAGEILLTSIDRDGTKIGFDCEMTAAVSSAVNIPVIASGGAGSFDHFVDVFTAGRADAALAASIFHYAERSVSGLKSHLHARGIPVRQ